MTSKFKALKFSTEQRKLRKTDIPNKFEGTVRLQKSLKNMFPWLQGTIGCKILLQLYVDKPRFY